ncbi:MAG: serine protease [Polyangiaceae bacterium]
MSGKKSSMTLRQIALRIGTTALAACHTLACSNDSGSNAPSTPIDLPEFRDPDAAPRPIRSAAQAVVRLHTARAYGTGAYISSTGRLLTNNHVLGESVCSREGCYVEVSESHQRGKARRAPVVYRAIPEMVSAGLDVAILQLSDVTTGEPPETPNYLTFDERSAEELLGQTITVVGHPEGNLKKWTKGEVIDEGGHWLTTTAYVLPGDSGSPMLDEHGRIVGLVHRAPNSLDLISERGVNVYSIGTASQPLVTFLTAGTADTLLRTEESHTEAEFLSNDLVFLNARVHTIDIEGTSTNALDILGRACDTALNQSNFGSMDEMYEALTPCDHAQTWIECREADDGTPYTEVCPSEQDRERWRERFLAMNAIQVAMTSAPDYTSVGPAIARLATSRENGLSDEAAALEDVLDATKPALDFELAYYLAMFDIESYAGKSVRDYVRGYEKNPVLRAVGGIHRLCCELALLARIHFVGAIARTSSIRSWMIRTSPLVRSSHSRSTCTKWARSTDGTDRKRARSTDRARSRASKQRAKALTSWVLLVQPVLLVRARVRAWRPSCHPSTPRRHLRLQS